MSFVEEREVSAGLGVPRDPSNPGLRPRYRDIAAVAACIVASVLTVTWTTHKLYYTQDDWVFLEQAQTSPFGLTYLRNQLFQHFSPISRVSDYLVVHDLHSDYTDVRSIELSLLGVAVLVFAWTVKGFVGQVWWRHLLTMLFAESLALVHLLDWWTATANILPATILGLGTLGAFVRFRRRGGFKWGLLTVVCYALSLLSHEQSWLVFGYLLLFEVLVITPPRSLRDMLHQIGREWRLWVPLAVRTGAAIVNYLLFYYAELRPRPTAGQMFAFVRILFDEAFAPSAAGLRPLSGGVVPRYAWAIDVVIVLIVVTATIVRSRRAWRAWVVFALGFLANALMIGLNRVGVYGPLYGREMYYVQAPAYLFILCLGAAIGMPRGGWKATAPRHAARDLVRRPALRTCLVLGLAVLCYQAAFFQGVISGSHQTSQDGAGRLSNGYFATLTGQIRRLEKMGYPVVLVDGSVPFQIVIPNFAPFNTLSSTIGLVDPGVRFGPPGRNAYSVSPTGSLVPDPGSP
jgi:hypothetical protein